MTAAGPVGDAAWVALLPDKTVWLPRPPRRPGATVSPSAGSFAAAAPPWSLRLRHRRRGIKSYVAVPSRQRPLIVASWDPAVLRYLADTVLSVPPGSGPVLSAVVTAGLRMLRFRGVWLLAVALRAGGAVLVGRSE
jgi:hypothetical protein